MPIRLLRKLREQVVDPKINLLNDAVNDIFPDVTALDKIPEIKDIIIDVLDGPPYDNSFDLATIIDKLKTRKIRIDYFVQ